MRTFLVTGGAGFIGSHIVEALVSRGDRVRVLDNLSTGKLANLAPARQSFENSHIVEAQFDRSDRNRVLDELSTGALANVSPVEDQVELIEGDLVDPQAVREAVDGVDCIFHMAALASVPLSVERPLETHAACVTGTLNLLDAARRAGVRRLVYAASSAAYGDRPTLAKRETDLTDPISPYGAAKLAAELYCQAFTATYGFETVCLRYFNVFGPRQDPDSPYSAVIPLFLTAMLSGRQPFVYGDGRQSRDFTFVSNVVDGNLLAADAPGIAGRVFNIANGRSMSLLELIAALNDLLGTDVQPIHRQARVGDVRESMADITQARQLLGYEPRVGFEEGLRRSIGYYRELVEQLALRG